MRQGVLPIKYEKEKKDFGLTSFSGLFLYLDLLAKMNFWQIIRKNLRAKEGKQGWNDAQFLVTVIFLNLCGGDCVDDIDRLEKDEGIRRILKNIELSTVWGRRRQKLKRQWRNNKQNILPSPSSMFRYLSLFHDTVQEQERKEGEAFIPKSNENLSGLCNVNAKQLAFLQLNKPEEIATLDMDATIVASSKEEALYSYKKYKGYQPLNTWWWEQGALVHTEFRDGNVPAGFEQKRILEEALACLPAGVKKVYLRSDTAGYQHDLLRYCESGENDRFGRIEFAISCDVTVEFKKAVFAVEDSQWLPVYKKEGDGKLKATGQEWAEVCFVPNAISRSKKGPDYRYFAIREKLEQQDFSEMELQMSFPFPTMKLRGNRYKLHGIVSNIGWSGEEIIHWNRKRCGYSEQVHSEMKEAFAGGQLPSGKFGANAAWWWMMLIAYNLNAIMRNVVLDNSWKQKRMKAIRYSLLQIAGRVIKKGGELVIRLTKSENGNMKGDGVFDMLVRWRAKILSLAHMPPGE